MMEPLVRFELTTVRLQGGCSTTELKRHGNEVAHIYRRWPVVASRKWIVRHGYFHFKRLKTFQESNREPCSSGGSAGGRSGCLPFRFLISGLGRRHDAGNAFHRMPGNDISLGTAVFDSQVREVEGPDQVTEFQDGF